MAWDTGALRDIRAVAVDVDGTIAGLDHQVNDRTAAAIRGVLDEGLPVFLLTGRSRRSVLELARELGIRNGVAAANGSVSFDPVADEDTRTVAMGEQDITAALRLHHAHGLALTWWTRDSIWVDSPGPMADTLIALNDSHSDIRVGAMEDVRPGEIIKMMLYGTREELDAAAPSVHAQVPHATRSMDEFYEFGDPEATKWDALQHLLGDDIAPGEVMGLGDGGNDVPWLSRIGFPVAMGNARAEVRAVARATTGHHGQDGAAVALERLLAARRGND